MAPNPEPGPSERINLGDPTVPRTAATVILLRDSVEDGRLEVLLLRRSAEARFMPNVWVFPGGALDPEDGDGLDGLRICAIRELHEESGVRLHPETRLVPLARWVTPEVIKTRFDTWFFLAASPPPSGTNVSNTPSQREPSSTPSTAWPGSVTCSRP